MVDNGSFDAGIGPHTGLYDFRGGKGAWGTLTQNVALSGLGQSRQPTLSFWERGLNQGMFDVPLDAIAVDYTMQFQRNFGKDLDAFIDDNSLTLTTNVPEPSTGWLTFAGLGLMGALLRRRARR